MFLFVLIVGICKNVIAILLITKMACLASDDYSLKLQILHILCEKEL